MSRQKFEWAVQINSSGVEITLSGYFHADFIPSLKEKIENLLEDGHRFFMMNMNDLNIDYMSHFKDLQFFIELANGLQAKDGKIIFILPKEKRQQFKSVEHLLHFYSNQEEFRRSGWRERFKQTGVYLSRKTGIRLSVRFATVLSILIFGWMLTLVVLVQKQNVELDEKKASIVQLEKDQARILHQINLLQGRLEPFRQLGILSDSLDVLEQSIQKNDSPHK